MNPVGYLGWLLLGWLSLGLAQAAPVHIELAGLRLNANWEQSAPQPKPQLYLLVHGTLAHNQMEIISELQQRLKQTGRDSLAINLSLGVSDRSSTMFPCAEPHLHQHSDAIREIAAWLDWAKRQGVHTVTLVGHSRGGNQAAWAVTELSPPLVKQLVLLAPMTWSAEAERANYQKRYGEDLDTVLQQAQAAGATRMTGVDFIYCPGATVQATSVLDYYRADMRKDTPHLLQKIRLPTLVVIASEDDTVTDLAAKLQPINNPQVKLHRIEGADHFFRDLYLDEVIEAMLAF